MLVIYFHNQYDKTSRDTLNALLEAGANVTIHKRFSPDNDLGYWISTLPTVLCVEESTNTELARADRVADITKANVDWMHQQYATWVANGSKKGTFPKAPWA